MTRRVKFKDWYLQLEDIVDTMENAPMLPRDVAFDLWFQGIEPEVAIQILLDLGY